MCYKEKVFGKGGGWGTGDPTLESLYYYHELKIEVLNAKIETMTKCSRSLCTKMRHKVFALLDKSQALVLFDQSRKLYEVTHNSNLLHVYLMKPGEVLFA